MKICHISDTHGQKFHTKLIIPECDVLIHSGDIGGRTTISELKEFLEWFNIQPARKKIWVAGNHDLIMDEDWVGRQKEISDYNGLISRDFYIKGRELINSFDTVYLNNEEYVYEGVKFFGSPISPSFHKKYWVFNRDRGNEIRNEWNKIPNDAEILITHTPPYGILDSIEDIYKEEIDEDTNVGCKDLLKVIEERLYKLKLHCFGHIHDNYGVILKRIPKNRRVLFSNGAVLTNSYTQLINKPIIINYE